MAINDVQAKIKALHGELEKTHRGEDRYLTLITQVMAPIIYEVQSKSVITNTSGPAIFVRYNRGSL